MINRFSVRLQIPVIYVANHPIPLPESELCTMVVCAATEGAADDYIVEHSEAPCVAVTRDIPLAARLVERGVTVVNDRGVVFTPDNIRERLSERDFHVALAEVGIGADKTGVYGKRDLQNFANCLDRLLKP
jgi:uncharacterized protein YaiI (UPF0178 family)